MSEPLIMPIRHGSLSPHDKKKLSDAGVIVIEHDHPDSLKILRPSSVLNSDDMTLAALKALTGKSLLTSEARSEFAFLIARAFEASMSKAKGESNAA